MQQAMEKINYARHAMRVRLGSKIIPIEYSAVALKDEAGNIIGGLEYVIDITERVRHEQKLQEQSRTIRANLHPGYQAVGSDRGASRGGCG